MKNSRDTIISFIERLYSDNNNLMIRYEYNEIKGKHIVEILSKTGVLCEEFIWESKYDLSRMIKKEFGETLMFVSDNSLTKISNPIFEVGYNSTLEVGYNSFTVNNNIIYFKSDFDYWFSLENYSLAA